MRECFAVNLHILSRIRDSKLIRHRGASGKCDNRRQATDLTYLPVEDEER